MAKVLVDPNLIMKAALEDFRTEEKGVKQETDGERGENYDFAHLYEHLHQLISENPGLKEELEEIIPPFKIKDGEEPSEDDKVKYWSVGDAISDHFKHSLEIPRKDRKFEHVDDKIDASIDKVTIPSEGFPKIIRDQEDNIDASLLNQSSANITSTIHMLYRLAGVMDLDPTSEEAEIITAALETMGAANFMNKKIQAKFQTELLSDPAMRLCSMHSWESLPGTLFDIKKLEGYKVKMGKRNDEMFYQPPTKKKRKN